VPGSSRGIGIVWAAYLSGKWLFRLPVFPTYAAFPAQSRVFLWAAYQLSADRVLRLTPRLRAGGSNSPASMAADTNRRLRRGLFFFFASTCPSVLHWSVSPWVFLTRTAPVLHYAYADAYLPSTVHLLPALPLTRLQLVPSRVLSSIVYHQSRPTFIRRMATPLEAQNPP